MGFVAHSVDTARVNPAIVKVKECAHGDGVIDALVGETDRVQLLNVFGLNIVRITIHLANEPHESFFGFGQGRSFEVFEDTLH